MMQKFDLVLVGIGTSIALMAIAFQLFGPIALIIVSILAISLTGYALFGMGAGR